LGNKQIIAAVELVLSAVTDYGLYVDYDTEGNPVIQIAPKRKISQMAGNRLIST
jgi:hypothetical protein